MTKAFISGCAGTDLSAEERAFFRAEDPWGLILFRRNVASRDQVRALTAAFRDSVGRANAPVLIDQEGGRVQRLRPPEWPEFPAQKRFGDLYRMDRDTGLRAARLGARLIADELASVGITVDCLPLLDVAFPDTVDAIGDRAFGSEPDMVADLGRAVAEGLMAGGVLPVMKHLPGHGRARVDSHLELPRVAASRADLTAIDFRPFRLLRDLPLAMTAHILFEALDRDVPATQSKIIIDQIIRAEIGFDGCLMTDDLSMKALSGSTREKTEASFAAGCDLVLHCNGEPEEMRQVAASAPVLSGKSLDRCERALSGTSHSGADFDRDTAWSEFAAVLEQVA